MSELRDPICNIESEKAVLGSILLANETLAIAQKHLGKQDFYDIRNQIIFEQCVKIHEAMGKVDLTLLIGELNKTGQMKKIGEPGYIVDLESYCLTPANIEQYSKAVKEASIKRRLITYCKDLEERIYTDDLEEVMEVARGELDGLRIKAADEKKVVSMGEPEFVMRNIERIAKNQLRQKEAVESCLAFVNYANRGGLLRSEVAFLCSRPGIAKTSLAIQQCAYTVKKGECVLFFSMELNEARAFERLVKIELGYKDPEHKTELSQAWKETLGRFGQRASAQFKEFYIYYDSMLTTQTIDLQLENLKAHNIKPKLVVIDHFHRMVGEDRKKSEVARETERIDYLAAIAGKHECAMFILGHPVKPAYKKFSLTMDDIRGAGAISGACKLIIMMSEWEKDDWDKGTSKPKLSGRDKGIQLKIAKSNEGECDTRSMIYHWNSRKIISIVDYENIKKQQVH